MNVTVAEAPRDEPRIVAPAEMVGGRARQEAGDSRQGGTGRESGGSRSPGSSVRRQGGAQQQTTTGPDDAAAGGTSDRSGEAFLSQTVLGWPVLASLGSGIGEVGNVILLDTGEIGGVPDKVGDFLGLDLATRLFRLDAADVSVDLADEAVVTNFSEEDVTQRESHEGPELAP